MAGRIEIDRTRKADTRIGNEVTKAELLSDTKRHIAHVQAGIDFICECLREQGLQHDHTKIQFIDEFHADFVSTAEGKEFKDGDWWQYHLEERHHLKDRVPRDVNLIDVLEMIIDCCVAGKARSGDVYPIEIDPEVLDRAVQNTRKLLISSIDVVEDSK